MSDDCDTVGCMLSSMMSFTCILLNEAAATQPAEKYHDSSTIQPHSIKTAAAAVLLLLLMLLHLADEDDDCHITIVRNLTKLSQCNS